MTFGKRHCLFTRHCKTCNNCVKKIFCKVFSKNVNILQSVFQECKYFVKRFPRM